MKGQNEQTGLYSSRYYAIKDNPQSCIIVKVCGGYKAMTCDDYKIWRKQK